MKPLSDRHLDIPDNDTEPCDDCLGTGHDRYSDDEFDDRCQQCGGKGRVPVEVECPDCDGIGEVDVTPFVDGYPAEPFAENVATCERCDGKGQIGGAA